MRSRSPGTHSTTAPGRCEPEIHKVSRPLNDNFADATAIGPELPISVAGNNTDATVETGEPAPALNYEPIATVWYRWDSNFNGPVDIQHLWFGHAGLRLPCTRARPLLR